MLRKLGIGEKIARVLQVQLWVQFDQHDDQNLPKQFEKALHPTCSSVLSERAECTEKLETDEDGK